MKTALQAAFDANGCVELEPDGVYALASNLTFPNALCIHGNNARIISTAAAVRNITADDTTGRIQINNVRFEDVAIKMVDVISSMEVRGCKFTGVLVDETTYNPFFGDVGVSGTTSLTYLVMEGCELDTVRNGFISAYGFGYVRINGNKFNNVGYRGVHIGDSDLAVGNLGTALINNNQFTDVADDADGAYAHAIGAWGSDIICQNNYCKDVINSSYWEVDGIYVKAIRANISGNVMHNAGYRAAIQTKQLGDNGATASEAIVIDGNTIFFDASSTGLPSPAEAPFSSGDVYGGINCVNYNATVSNNTIVGAGYGIYSVNSYSMWLVKNLTISNNTIIGTRNKASILLFAVGDHISITDNKILNPVKTFAEFHYGIWWSIQNPFNNDEWVTLEDDYNNKQIDRATISGNIIHAMTYNSTTSNTGIVLEARDSVINTDTFTVVNQGTDRATVTGHLFQNHDGVQLTTSGSLPTGLSTATDYYIKRIDANTLEFYTDSALSSIVNITGAGSGTHTITGNGKFDNLIIEDNNIAVANQGAGVARGLLVQLEAARFTNASYHNNNVTDFKTAAATLPSGQDAKYMAISDGDTGGTASAGAGNQYVEIEINGTIYKVLHDGTV
jgi:hypothetical protein